MTLPTFLAMTFAISLSGALSPGPVMAATLGYGTNHRHAGAPVTLGHTVIEFPVILLVLFGAGAFLKNDTVRTVVALAGGICLLWMGLGMLRSAWRSQLTAGGSASGRGPFSAGVLLSASNPYTYLWWLSVGITLIAGAQAFGPVGIVLFVLVHWACDLCSLWLLSALSFKGSQLFGTQFQTGIFVVCGLALAGFGAKFLFDATSAHLAG